MVVEKYPVFLHWNRKNVNANIEVTSDQKVHYNEISATVLELLAAEAHQSTDWWRHIGAVLCEGDEILLYSHNKHLPSQYTPYIDGDMRMSLNRGAGIELIGSEHAEASVLAKAAAKGIKTKGLDLYTSTFPCPPCAKFIAGAGIANMYYQDGYAMGNGLEALKVANVNIIQIIDSPQRPKTKDQRPYPEKTK
jgi:dCMP deaminase